MHAAIVRVDDHAADQAADQGRHKADQADDAQAQRRARDRVHLPQDERLQQTAGEPAAVRLIV